MVGLNNCNQTDILKTKIRNLIAREMEAINKDFKISSLNERNRNISLFSGVSGAILCNFFVGQSLKDSKFLGQGEDLLDHLLKILNEKTFKLSNFFSFCNGLSGVCFLLDLLYREGFIKDSILDDMMDVEEFLFELGLKSIKVGKSDFLHGGMGVLYYFLKRTEDKINEDRVIKMVEAYYDSARIDHWGMRMKNSVLLEREEEEFDLGLAHGLSGHLMILSEVYKKGICKELIDELILKGVQYIENKSLNPEITGYKGMYPVSFIEKIPFDDPKNIEFYDSRLGWCYGDLNYAMMYLKLYEIFGINTYRNKALEIGRFAANRMCLENAKIKNVFFCHGSSGVSFMFLKLFRFSSEHIFYEANQFWLEHVIENIDHNVEFQEEFSKSCLLNGRGGVILSLLAQIGDVENNWSELYLLN